MQLTLIRKGASINYYVEKQGRGRVGQMSTILIYPFVANLSTKARGYGAQKTSKSCQRSLWMPPKTGNRIHQQRIISQGAHNCEKKQT